MPISRLFNISLARKCQLLFGMAVLLIIAAALFVPGYSMETFVHEINALRARNLGMMAMARIDPTAGDWAEQQRLLNDWWTIHTADLKLPETKPRLIPLPSAEQTASPQVLAAWFVEFQSEHPWLFWPAGYAVNYIQRSPPVLIAGVGWELLAESTQDRFAYNLRRAGFAVVRHVARQDALFTQVDPFLVQAVKQMQTDESIGMLRETYREQGGPRVYRVVMAVRNVERQPGRSPLVGLIDVRLPAPQSDEMLLLTRLILVLAGMLAGFLAILVFYLISQKLILAPVRELKELAEEIAAGDLSARAALETGDEFEELSDSFNNMLTQLEGSRLELETINRSLDARLGELAETNVALYEANKIKSEFLANVSHELRTPLTSIIGFADLLRDFLQSKEEPEYGRLARYANNIITSGRQLLDMINDLLELTRMEAGKVTLHRTRFSVLDVCEALFDFMRPIVDKKQLTLTSEVTDDLPHLHSDAGKLRQILYNLLSNAVKYTPEGGRVELTARSLEDGQKVELTVRDTGPGIAPEDHERIFEKFRQLDASVTREQGGTGLGLAITKELCQMLGGEIHLESQPGRGAKFIVLLPVESPTTAQRNLTPLT